MYYREMHAITLFHTNQVDKHFFFLCARAHRLYVWMCMPASVHVCMCNFLFLLLICSIVQNVKRLPSFWPCYGKKSWVCV